MSAQEKRRARRLTATPLVELREQSPDRLLLVSAWEDPAAVAAAVAEATGARLDGDPRVAAPGQGGCTVYRHGPGNWLIRAVQDLPREVDGQHCAVTDVSHSRCLFSVRGIAARRFVESGCALDVDGLPPGCAALTAFDHYDVLLHRIAEDAFDMYVDRTLADDFRAFAVRRAATMTVHVAAIE